MNIESEMKKLYAAQKTYDGVIKSIESKISDKVQFEFSIHNQPGDGFVLLDYDSANLCGLENALKVINDKGTLSKDDHKGMTF